MLARRICKLAICFFAGSFPRKPVASECWEDSFWSTAMYNPSPLPNQVELICT